MDPGQIGAICRMRQSNLPECNSWEFWEQAARDQLGVSKDIFYGITGYMLTTPQERYLEFASRIAAFEGSERYKALNLCLVRAASDKGPVQYFIDQGADDYAEAAYHAARENHRDILELIIYNARSEDDHSVGMGIERGYAERGLLINSNPSIGALLGASRSSRYGLVKYLIDLIKPNEGQVNNALIAWSSGYAPSPEEDREVLHLLLKYTHSSPLARMHYEAGRARSHEKYLLLSEWTHISHEDEYNFGLIASGVYEVESWLVLSESRISFEIGYGGAWNLIDRITDWDEFLTGAARGGHLDMVRYALLAEPDIVILDIASETTDYEDISEFLKIILGASEIEEGDTSILGL